MTPQNLLQAKENIMQTHLLWFFPSYAASNTAGNYAYHHDFKPLLLASVGLSSEYVKVPIMGTSNMGTLKSHRTGHYGIKISR